MAKVSVEPTSGQVPVYVCDMGELADLGALRVPLNDGTAIILIDSGQDEETIAGWIAALIRDGEEYRVTRQRRRGVA